MSSSFRPKSPKRSKDIQLQIPVGSVVVYDKGVCGFKAGYVEVTTQINWACSDGCQNLDQNCFSDPGARSRISVIFPARREPPATPAYPITPRGTRASSAVWDIQLNWNMIEMGFSAILDLRLKEIESSMPGRFYNGIVVFALAKQDRSDHFLMLSCGSDGDCNALLDAMEERVKLSCLLQAIPTKEAKDQLYDPETWEPTPLGKKYINMLHKRYPDLYQRLDRLALRSV